MKLSVSRRETNCRLLHFKDNMEELGGSDYRVHFTDKRDVTNRIVQASVARDWELTEIRLEKSSLDTIFAELSKK